MEKLDFKVGQSVYLKVIPGSGVVRSIKGMKSILDNPNEWIKDATVVSVGRKYITVKCEHHSIKFDISKDFRESDGYGGGNYELFLSKESIFEDVERRNIFSDLRYFFGQNSIPRDVTLGQLQQITSILGIDG